MSEKKVRSHSFCKSYPILAMILFSVGGMIAISMISSIFGGLLSLIMDKVPAGHFGTAIASVVVLLLYKLWFSPQFKGQAKSGLSKKWTLIMALPGILYIIYTFISQMIQYHGYFKPSLLFVAMAFAAGFGEEPMFRGFAIPIGMGFIKNKKKVWLVPIGTAVVFGMIHLTNVFSGASVFNGILQACVTAMHGFYYGALLVATGSIVPSIVLHSVYDFVCFAGDPTLNEGVMAGQLSTFAVVESIVTGILMMVAAVYLLKKLGDQKVLSVWKTKWSQNTSATTESH